MRKFALLSLVLVLAIGFAGVTAQDIDYESVDPSGATITYWHQYNSGAQLDTMVALVEAFNETNEYGITVEAVAAGDYGTIRDEMNAAIISGELPNLVAGFPNDMAGYAADDVIVDLTPFGDTEAWGFTDEELANLNLALFQYYIDDEGVLLAFPKDISANVLSVNLTMLAELGFDGPPTSPEEFVAVACAAAEADGINGYPIKADASNFESYLAGFGGTLYADGAFTLDTPEVRQVLQFYQDLYESDCAYIPDSRFGNTDDFAIGLNPMALGSSAGIPFIQSGAADAGYEAEWTVTVTPYNETPTIQLFGPSIGMLVATPEEEVASWLFLKYLAETENQATWAAATGYFPVNNAAAEIVAESTADNPQYQDALAIVTDPMNAVYSSPPIAAYGALRGPLSEAIADVTSNGRDVEEVVLELQAAADELLAD